MASSSLEVDLHLQSEENWETVLAHGIRLLLASYGETDPECFENTPDRVVKAYKEYLSGTFQNPSEILSKTFEVKHLSMVIVKDITFSSLCKHHHAPFMGKAHFGYIPRDAVVGLSKLPRLVECFARRFQLQESLSDDIVQAFDSIIAPQGCGVVIDAVHQCMCIRGVRAVGTSTRTHSLAGSFLHNPSVKNEFFEGIR